MTYCIYSCPITCKCLSVSWSVSPVFCFHANNQFIHYLNLFGQKKLSIFYYFIINKQDHIIVSAAKALNLSLILGQLMIQPLSIIFFYQTQSSLILICLIYYLISVIRFINPFPLMAMFLCLTFSYPLHYMSSYTLESFSYYCSWRAFGWLIGSKCLLVLILSLYKMFVVSDRLAYRWTLQFLSCFHR